MAGQWLIYVTLCLHLRAVLSSTLYQWIVDSRTRFNYDPDRTNSLGVYNWPRTYPESCSGQHQSPVDIDTNSVRYGIECPCPRMIYKSPVLTGELKNNGLSATFEPDNPMDFKIMDAPQRPGTYYLNDFHLHFGGVTGRSFELQGMRFRGSGVMSAGSEHTIDGLRFEGELHVVFYNSKYMNLEEAESKDDGVVVITLLVQKLSGTMVDNGETSEFSRFLEENIPKIQPYQQNASIEVDLRTFFNRRCEFYTYSGSITTPTCHESVRWVIMRDPIMVTERAWFRLTGLQSRGDFNSRFGNYRTTQPLNDRVIEANFMPEEGELPVRPMPDGEPIRGPGMFMGRVQQTGVPFPVGGDQSPMLNNNPSLMFGMQNGGNRAPMLNGNPNLVQQMSQGGNRSPMLNGNPNLMMPMPPGGNRSPMLNGNPNLMSQMTSGESQSVMLNSNPNIRSMFMPVFNQDFVRNNNNNNNNNNNDDENNNSMTNRSRRPMMDGSVGTRPMLNTGMAPAERMVSMGEATMRPAVNRGQSMTGGIPPSPLQMVAISKPNQATISQKSVPQKVEMQGGPGSMMPMGPGRHSKQAQRDQGGMVGSGGGQMESGGQSMILVPINMLDWLSMRRRYMAGLNADMMKTWRMFMTNKMG